MTTHHPEHLLDRAVMLAMRAFLAVQPKPEFSPEARPDFDHLMERTPAADGITYEEAEINGVSGYWCRPQDPLEDCAIVYLHGGAYILGSAAAYRHFVGQIVARTKAPALIVDYRLAPEHPFPAALDDAESVYRGLSEAGISSIAIAGDSAGGGLALALLQLMATGSASGSVRKPAAAAVLSAWADLALTGESLVTRASADPLLTKDALAKAAAIYLGPHDVHDPKATPVNGRFAGLPPVLLHVGNDEILLDDSCRIAQRIEAAGGSADLHIWQGMAHVFPASLELKAAVEALDLLGAFLHRHLQSKRQGNIA